MKNHHANLASQQPSKKLLFALDPYKLPSQKVIQSLLKIEKKKHFEILLFVVKNKEYFDSLNPATAQMFAKIPNSADADVEAVLVHADLRDGVGAVKPRCGNPPSR